MKPKHSIRISVTVCIILLCMGFGVYSFVRLNMVDERRDFDLYSLVPQEVEAVFATDKLTGLLENISQMECSRDNHYLYASELFSCVKRYLQLLMEKEPHGLSAKMNEMLISFHPSDLKNDQVLYCKLGLDDCKMLEDYIKRYGASGFPSKTFTYRGQDIVIYPLSDGRFLSLWMKRDFLVISFQKRLVEQVIDAWKDKKSLARLATFRPALQDKREARKAVLFMRWQDARQDVRPDSSVWLEFDLKLAEEGIYCAGTAYGISPADTCRYAFAGCSPQEGFPLAELPRTTLLYRCSSLPASGGDWPCFLQSMSPDSLLSADGPSFDRSLAAYLSEHACGKALSCLFLSGDSLERKGQEVLSVSLKEPSIAQRDLHQLLYDISQGQYPFYKSFSAGTGVRGMRLYRLPSGTLASVLAVSGEVRPYTYATFYAGRLLLASEESALVAYVKALEQGDTLETSPLYETMVEQLAPLYDYVLMADLETMALCPSLPSGLLPSFFEEHAGFFSRFQLAVQLCRVDGAVAPNVVLLYRLKDAVSQL